mmetsp:Transcript_59107/g.114028  ORF Transcript_59107/g.114028 Transcript_59107/m.114028 type:complete len:621 (+) Transcript_59107:183-2045(+)
MLQGVKMGGSTMQVATALLEEERHRNAEIAALEWKLRGTRQRHIEELVHYAAMDRSGMPGTASATAQQVGGYVGRLTGAASSTWPSFPPAKVAVGSPFGAVRARAAQTTPRELSTGPTLATRQRHIQGRRVQLWVEDRLASQTARFHVMDEDGSWRAHRDVPDDFLSRLFESFRHRRGGPLAVDDQVDIDDFLHALLDGIDLVEAPSGSKGPELSLPPHFNSFRSAQATPKWTGGGAGSIGKLDHHPTNGDAGSTSSCCGGSLQHNGTLLPGSAPIAAAAAAATISHPPLPQDKHRGCAGPSSLSQAESHSPTSAWPVQATSTTPCLPWGDGPSEESACFRADGYLVNLTVAASGRSELAATDLWHSGQRSHGHLCIGQMATSRRSSPCRVLARPQSAPNRRAKRPQSGYRFSLDRDRTVRAASPVRLESSRNSSSRRVRPSSAKASKHRRCAEDDGNDCIIYEDVEGENEEWEPGENHLAAMEAGKRSGTGGCGSRSSLHGSVSSRSHSRQPSLHTCGRITSRPSSATSDCGTLVLDESMKIPPDEEIPGMSAPDEGHTANESMCGAGAASEPEAEWSHDAALLSSAAATAAATATETSSGAWRQPQEAAAAKSGSRAP